MRSLVSASIFGSRITASGLTAAAAASRRNWQMCPPEVQPAIEQAFRLFGMVSTEP